MYVKTRYTDKELEMFKALIEQKLEKTRSDLEFLYEQIQDLAHVMEEEGDWMDSNSNSSEMEMLHTMVNRQHRHLNDLENALIRIRNKTYGVCSVTGELIDLRRLMAVPTTTKSLAAKNAPTPAKEKEAGKPGPSKHAPQIITKVIRKKTAAVAKPIIMEEDEDEVMYDNEYGDQVEIDDTLLRVVDLEE